MCSKTYCSIEKRTDEIKFSSKGMNIRPLEETVVGPPGKYIRVLDEKTNVQSTLWGFPNNSTFCLHIRANDEKTVIFLSKTSFFYYGIDTKTLLL